MTDADLGTLFGELFGSMLGRTPDVHTTLMLTDAEAATGVTREVPITRALTCASCEGRGGATPADVKRPCTACDGKGGREQTQGFFVVRTSCEACKGLGATITNPCARCAGNGVTSAGASVSVTVPPGAPHGSTLRFEGEGNMLADGSRGALLVYLVVGDRPDPRAEDVKAAFERMLLEPNMPRAIVRRPRGGPVLTPPLLFGLVIGAVLLLLGLLR